MLRLMLMLLPTLIACHDVFFGNTGRKDGASCSLARGGTGQCLQISECGEEFSEMRNRCGFSNRVRLICCDVIRRQCEDIRRFSQCPFKDHLVGDVKDAEQGEFPFMALITFKSVSDEDSSQMRCGAALVSKRFLLTAAHCIKNGTGFEPYSVKLGTIEASDPDADSYLIETVYKHEDYRHLRKHNDIGLVKLKSDVELNCQTQPICIYTNPEDLPESVNLTVMGWGKGNNDEISEVLLKGIVNPVPRSTCQARFNVGYANRIQLKDNQMCALGDNVTGTATDTCQGDSGGPMVLKKNDTNYLVGLVSTGPGCGSGYAGIYTIVHKFLPWIIENGVFRNQRF